MGVLHVVGPQDSQLALHLAQALAVKFLPVSINRFADSESSIVIQEVSQALQNLEGSDVLLVYQFSNISSFNDQLFDLFVIADLFKQMGVKKIAAFLPYLPYARQDLSSDTRHAGVIHMLKSLCKQAGIDQIITCDVHNPVILNQEIPAKNSDELVISNISLASFWSDSIEKTLASLGLRADSNPEIVLASPDAGGILRVQQIAELLRVQIVHSEKTRVGQDHAVVQKLIGDVQGKTVVLVDDIIDTARTAVHACELLLSHGAARVIGCFSHAVLSTGAIDRVVQSCFEHVFITDTCKSINQDGKQPAIKASAQEMLLKITLVSVQDFLAQEIKKILLNVSVTSGD